MRYGGGTTWGEVASVPILEHSFIQAKVRDDHDRKHNKLNVFATEMSI